MNIMDEGERGGGVIINFLFLSFSLLSFFFFWGVFISVSQMGLEMGALHKNNLSVFNAFCHGSVVLCRIFFFFFFFYYFALDTLLASHYILLYIFLAFPQSCLYLDHTSTI
jgi:hypothetical protein